MDPSSMLRVCFSSACFILCAYQVYQCYQKFLAKEKSVSVQLLESQYAPFPELTICPSYLSAYREESLKRFYGVGVDDIRRLGFVPSNISTSTEDFFLNITHEWDDLVKDIKINTLKRNQPNQTKPKTFTKDELSFVTKWYLIYGRCYSLLLGPHITKFGIQDIEMTFGLNVFVFFHHPGQFVLPDSKTKLESQIGSVSFVEVTHESFTDIEDLERKNCDLDMDTGYDHCLATHVDQGFRDIYSCSPPYLDPLVRSSPVCPLAQFSRRNQSEFHRKYLNLFFNDVPGEQCHFPCISMSIRLGEQFMTWAEHKKTAYLKLYFKERIIVRRSVYSYQILSLLAEVGGYVSLILGYSLKGLTKQIPNIGPTK